MTRSSTWRRSCAVRTRSSATVPRTGKGAGNTNLHYQYNGTRGHAYAIVNDDTGDIVSIYVNPDNDWIGCANGL